MLSSLSKPQQSQYQIRTMHGPNGQFSYLDANNNSRYDAGDSVVLSDINGDGSYDASDALGTSKIFNLMKDQRNPNIDDIKGLGIFPNNGAERREARIWGTMMHKVDPNKDGLIASNEITGCGTQNLILANDHNRDGKFTGQDLRPGGNYWLSSVSGGQTANVTVYQTPAALGNLRANALPAR